MFPSYTVKDGFFATSTQEILVGTPEEHKKGEPDLFIYDKKKLVFRIEVTGSNIEIGDKELFLRPDKIQWAIQHPDVKTRVFFIYLDKSFYVEDITELSIFPIKQRILKGVPERYHIIPQSAVIKLSELEKFRQKLRNEVEKAKK